MDALKQYCYFARLNSALDSQEAAKGVFPRGSGPRLAIVGLVSRTD